MRRILGLALLVAVGGCRIYGPDSFLSATTENPPPTWGGDKYASGGLAGPSGGTKVKTRYTAGSQATSNQRIDPRLNRAAKGTGQMAGELSGYAAPGNGRVNAPAEQGTATIRDSSQ